MLWLTPDTAANKQIFYNTYTTGKGQKPKNKQADKQKDQNETLGALVEFRIWVFQYSAFLSHSVVQGC